MFHKIVVLTALLSVVQCAVEPGIVQATLSRDNMYVSLIKTLFNETSVDIIVNPDKEKCQDATVKLTWLIRGTKCMGLYNGFDPAPLLDKEQRLYKDETAVYMKSSKTFNCDSPLVIPYSNAWEWIMPNDDNTTAENRKRRQTVSTKVPTEISATSPVHRVANVPMAGSYIVYVRMELDAATAAKNAKLDVKIKVKAAHGYLSADQYPLLSFYMIMCIIYALYGLAWFVMSACNYRDLLRVQFWIGGVILLGMIEKAVFYSEYLNVNTTGISVVGAAKFAEVVSALKRAVARMLVIIVSLGFGIVKPRLGPMLHRVIGVGILWFILAVVEAMVRNDAALHDPDKNRSLMLAFIPLAVLDSIICWWIFMSLLQTMKTLRLRRNTVKLSLYRHFSNLIIFCVLASIVMVLWSIQLHQNACVEDWTEIWMDVAFWNILFSVILLVIMILWRPNVNNQRYAYSPMIDGNDSDLEEMDEAMLGSGATEGMKMRGPRKSEVDNNVNKTEEDLKWIEENIPQTIADAALPAFADSDEEVLTTKYEMSKME